MMYGCAMALLLPKLTSYHKMLLKFCVYYHGNPISRIRPNIATSKKYQELRQQLEEYGIMLASLKSKNSQASVCHKFVMAATENKPRLDTDSLLFYLDQSGIDWRPAHADVCYPEGYQPVKEKLNPEVGKLLSTIELENISLLGDILEETDSVNYALMNHFRNGMKHYTGCWAFRTLKGLV